MTGANADISGRVYCRTCLADMEAIEYRRFTFHADGDPDRFLFWRCPNGHVTDLVPIPDSLVPSTGTATVAGVRRHGENGLQPPRMADAPSGELHR